MANPQKENGYTPIAHELMGAILVYPFTAYELRILFYILAETYGRQRKKTQISYGGIARHIKCARRNAIEICKRLKVKNVIFMQTTVNEYAANIFGVNKDYQTWKHWPKGYLVDKFGNIVMPGTLGSDAGDTMVVMPDTLSKGQSSDAGHTISSDAGHTTTKNEEPYGRSRKKGGTDNRLKQISKIIKGYEDCIEKNTAALVDRLYEHGFKDEVKVWAYIVQARSKNNPAGYLVKILANPQYMVADSAHEQAKREMRACGRY